ncbi:MAG TPA: serine/threonine-protein kinase [Ktedonobacteraceae bacterium]
MSTFGSPTGKLAPQTLLAQRYILIRVAGRGGMSAIYQAVDLKQGQMRVALKEMSLENLDEEERQDALARFQQEAHLLETLHHPNLTRIYDAFSENGRSFLVMDYIEGQTLLQLLQAAGKPLPVEQVMYYAEQLCDVLLYLHQHNPPIIFRDLKPTNVMATRAGHVYLIDFGIARFFKEGQSQDTTVLGSPGYAPPEQHGSGQTNPRSDLYALGATLHCCLSNRDPYHATDRFTFAPARQFNPLVPEALDRLILRMVAPDEHQRPTRALEVKQELIRIHQQLGQSGNNISDAQAQPVSALSTTPTQYIQFSPPSYQPTMPAIGQAGPQEKLILRAVPPSSPATPPLPAAYPGLPPTREQQGTGSRVWTPGFIILFLLFLLLTVGGSILTFTVANPYGPGNHASLDHVAETVLVIMALLISLNNLLALRDILASLATLGSGIALLAAGTGLLFQTLRDLQNVALPYSQLPSATLLNNGLLAAGMLELLWLLHLRLTWGDRCWLLCFFGIACLCAYLQASSLDSAQTKHFLLLGTLILLIQGILVARQMVHKRG